MADEATAVEATPQAPAPNDSPKKADELRRSDIHQRLQAVADEELAAEVPSEVTPSEGGSKQNPKTKASPQGGDKMSTLVSLAKELGLDVQGDKVSLKERTEFRDWKKRQTETLTLKEQQIQAQFQEALNAAKPRIEKAEAFAAAIDKGDILGAAKVMGYESWDDLQRHLISQTTDPNYKKMREMEARLDEQAKKEAQTAEEQKQQQESHQRRQAEQQYRGQMTETMKGSKHGLVASMHDDPLFLNAVMAIQGEHWDGETTVSAEQALKMGVKGASRTLEEELKGLYGKLHTYFGKQGAPEATSKKPAPKSAPVPPSKSGGAPSTSAKLSDSDLRADIRRRLMAQSIAERGR